MFVWDEDLGVSNQSVARYLAKGSGADSQIIRRFCKGTASPQDVVVARNFGTEGIKEASLFTLGHERADLAAVHRDDAASSRSPVSTTSSSTSIDACPGSAPGAYVPDAPDQRPRASAATTAPPSTGPIRPTTVRAITGYYLEQTPGRHGARPVRRPTGITGAQVNGLTNGQSYTFRVRAANVLGPGPYSAPTGAVTPGPSTPDAPTIGTATPDPAVNGQATITWSIPVGLQQRRLPRSSGYKVYAQHAPDAPIVRRRQQPGGHERDGHRARRTTPTYAFQVSARNAYGEGSPSALVERGADAAGQARDADRDVHRRARTRWTSRSRCRRAATSRRFTNFRAHVIETEHVHDAGGGGDRVPRRDADHVHAHGHRHRVVAELQHQGPGPERDRLGPRVRPR